MRTVYQLDGTEACFLTAVFLAYRDETAYLSSLPYLQVCLGERLIVVAADEEKAARVARKVKSIDASALFDVQTVLRSNAADKEQTAFFYLKELVETGRSVRGKLSVDCVRKTMEIRGQVLGEVHRLKGFLRFAETANGVMYAPCSPDHDVVELLVPHFVNRLQGLAFAIHDRARGKAALYNGRECVLAQVGDADLILTGREEAFSALWKKYYRTVNIPARKNERQRLGYMPKRYWKFLTEQPWEDEE